jgi:hypothetical protein
VSTANPRGLPTLSASFPLVPRALSPVDAQTLVAVIKAALAGR